MTMSQEMQNRTSSKTVEWFTPPYLIEMAREVLGGIDLDPASCWLPQTKWIRANRFYTESEGGLQFDSWNATTVWLNPPYGKTRGKSNQGIWTERLIREYVNGHITRGALDLINQYQGYVWFEKIWRRYPICCIEERLRFVNENGVVGNQAKVASCVICLGGEEVVERFRRIFKRIGRILMPD